MKNTIKALVWGFMVSFLTSCLDRIDIPLRQETQKLVVEGLITNDPKFVSLKISQTTSFGTSNSVEPFKGAYVEVRSSTSEVTVFRSVPDDIGFYRPNDPQWAGKIGVSYSIFIALPDGRTFQSIAQKMSMAVPITSLDAIFREDASPGIQTSVSFKDPVETENYYRWTASGFHIRLSTGVPTGGTICCNRCWVLKQETSVNLFSDLLINGNLVKKYPVFRSPFYAIGNHFIEVQQYTISKDAYLFWSRYKDQQQRTGSIFDPLPASLTGNVVNTTNLKDVALGFFEVSAVSHKRLEASVTTTQLVLAINFNNPLYVPEGDCILAYPFSVYATDNPPGW
jgi:Domain of unknown function (DUF4249)